MNRPSNRFWLTSSLALSLAVVAGCDQPGGGAPRAQTRAPGLVGMDLDTSVESVPPAAAPAPAPATPPPVFKARPILGKTTKEIDDPEKAKKAGAAPAPKQLSKDPFRVYGNAYNSILSQAATGKIKQAVELYRANNDGEYPKTQEEFMENVIKPNSIRLPVLPRNQKYVYDVATHELGIWEYPEGQ
jgi:hypothetical protein